MILRFKDFLKESDGMGSYGDFKMKDFILSREKDSDSEAMLDDLSSELENMDLPIGVEETGAINLNFATPSMTTDMKYTPFSGWMNRNHVWRIDSKEGIAFLEKLDKDYFVEREDELGNLVFYEAEAPAKLKKFAASWGYMATLLFFCEHNITSDTWVELVITFHKDEKIAHDNRGVIHSRKFGL
jgi:hypothetical protein